MKLTVIVHPNSKKAKTEVNLLGISHVYVSEPPLDDKANKAATKALTEYFKAGKSKVTLVGGAKSKQKIFEIG